MERFFMKPNGTKYVSIPHFFFLPSSYQTKPIVPLTQHILVAVAFEAGDSELLKVAAEQALTSKASVCLLHVAAPDPDFIGYSAGPETVRDARAEELHQEREQLHHYADVLQEQNIKATGMLVAGPTLETLKTEIEKRSIDLLIMGAHEHGFLHELFVGNTALEVVKQIRIPVLIIPIAT